MKTLIKILFLSVLWVSCESNPSTPSGSINYCEEAGFTDSNGDGICDEYEGCMDELACNFDSFVVVQLEGSCIYSQENYDCDNNCIAALDCAGECGGFAVEDCMGICEGNASLDVCSECNGPGIPEGYCDCNGNILDECGICNGNNQDLDDCGVCFGNNENLDCNGDCFGNAELDDCGTCDNDSNNDCIVFEEQVFTCFDSFTVGNTVIAYFNFYNYSPVTINTTEVSVYINGTLSLSSEFNHTIESDNMIQYSVNFGNVNSTDILMGNNTTITEFEWNDENYSDTYNWGNGFIPSCP